MYVLSKDALKSMCMSKPVTVDEAENRLAASSHGVLTTMRVDLRPAYSGTLLASHLFVGTNIPELSAADCHKIEGMGGMVHTSIEPARSMDQLSPLSTSLFDRLFHAATLTAGDIEMLGNALGNNGSY